MRHLTFDQATAAVRRGRQVEQLLGRHRLADGRVLLRWLSVGPSGRGFGAVLHEVFEVDWIEDSTELPPVNTDEYVGEGHTIDSFDSAEAAFEALGELGTRDDRWVNAGVIQDEINDARSATPSGSIDLSQSVLDFLLNVSQRADAPPWRSWLEDREGPGGDSFIIVGVGEGRLEDIYIRRDTRSRSNAEVDVIAFARSYLPLLLAEVKELRARLQHRES